MFDIGLSSGCPEGHASAQHHLFFNQGDPNAQPSIFRGKIAIEDGPFRTETWLEVHGSIPPSDSSRIIRPQRLTWENETLVIGYQQHRWGNLDVLSAVDMLSPKDMRWGPPFPLKW